MVAVADRQHLVGLALGGAQQHGRVVGFGARRGEEHLGVRDAGLLGDQLGQIHHRLADVEGRGVQDLRRLRLHRGGDLGQGVGGHRGEDPAEEVQVAGALDIPDVTALAVVQGDGLVVELRQPGWGDRPGAGGEVGVGAHGRS